MSRTWSSNAIWSGSPSTESRPSAAVPHDEKTSYSKPSMSILRRSARDAPVRRMASPMVTKGPEVVVVRCLGAPMHFLWYTCRAPIDAPSNVQSNVCTSHAVRFSTSSSNL
eukprot:Amastigsp_a512760_9.p3 type:complete len:111 gc:universal Amastigsp_a512760_9:767-435(-)